MTDAWPELTLTAWEDTYRTLHMWLQMVGKVRMARAPYENHWWHATLYVCPRGLTTHNIPANGGSFEIRLDFVDHRLSVETDGGAAAGFALEPMTVASFYGKFMEALREVGAATRIYTLPQEVGNPIRFEKDTAHQSYDRAQVEKVHRILLSSEAVMRDFRGRYLGKSSPVHFFWGAFDLAVTRFSGERNPQPPTDPVMGPAYSHAVISHGFWPGGDWPTGGRLDEAHYYSYALPEPPGFREGRVSPDSAKYDTRFGNFCFRTTPCGDRTIPRRR